LTHFTASESYIWKDAEGNYYDLIWEVRSGES